MSVLELDFSVRAVAVELEAGWQRGTSRSRPALPTNQARQDGSPAEAEGKPQSGAASMGPAATNRALSPLGSVVLVLYGPPSQTWGTVCPPDIRHAHIRDRDQTTGGGKRQLHHLLPHYT